MIASLFRISKETECAHYANTIHSSVVMRSADKRRNSVSDEDAHQRSIERRIAMVAYPVSPTGRDARAV